MSNSSPKGCLAFILGFFGIRLGRRTRLPYRQRDDFLTKTELSFYRVLVPVVDRRHTICTKVRVADILYVPNHAEDSQSYQNQISQKHVDFLLCEKESMRPVLVIELDDVSHNREDNKARDEVKNQAFEAAELPLLRIRAAAHYVSQELAQRIEAALSQKSSPSESTQLNAAVNRPASEIPTCPKCQVAMVLRTAKKGDHQRQTFWGCVNYPRCGEKRNHERFQ